jgi:hypothetical protein
MVHYFLDSHYELELVVKESSLINVLFIKTNVDLVMFNNEL